MQNPKTENSLIKNPMRRLFSYLGNYKTAVWSSSFHAIINKIFDLFPPILTAWTIDTVSGNIPAFMPNYFGVEGAKAAIILLGILTFVIFSLESFFEWLFQRGFMRLAQNVQHDLRVQAYDHLQKREIAFFEEQRTGNLMAIINDDINQLERFLNTSFAEILHLITLFIFAGISLFMVSPKLAFVGILPVPIIILVSIMYQKFIAPYYKKIREAVGMLASRLENNIGGIMVVKSFTAEKFERERVEKISENYRNANFEAIKFSTLYTPIIRVFVTLGFVGGLTWGAFMIVNQTGEITIGILAFFAMMVQRLLWPVTRLGRIFDEYERARASIRRVFGLMDAPSKITEKENAFVPKNLKGNIELQNVSFAYSPDIPILEDVNLSIKPQTTIGIAGQTGAGKTTLIKLFLRLYDVNKGAITIDGKDLRDFNLKALRENVALVSQDVYLFHGTVQENIAYSMPHLGQELIIAAAKKSALHDFIMGLPKGYDSIVGERGIKLSGGQRQRLSIARAILKNAPILILDEATSAVDTETERAIQENLNTLSEGKTAIIIAHRLSTIRKADKIVVLDNGKVAELGNHNELVAQKGIYADLWNVQLGEAI